MSSQSERSPTTGTLQLALLGRTAGYTQTRHCSPLNIAVATDISCPVPPQFLGRNKTRTPPLCTALCDNLHACHSRCTRCTAAVIALSVAFTTVAERERPAPVQRRGYHGTALRDACRARYGRIPLSLSPMAENDNVIAFCNDCLIWKKNSG